MFTGIVEEIGKVKHIRRGLHSSVLTVCGSVIMSDLKIGDSVAVNGVCLTASGLDGSAFTADVMHETLNRSDLGRLRPGDSVNLERALPAAGRFGGHIVSGHIDGTGEIVRAERDDNAVWYTVKADSELMRSIVEKGSVAIDGISLTVASVHRDGFRVSVIPHTAAATILGGKKAGDIVNLENDIIGKYVRRLLTFDWEYKDPADSKITREFLNQYGF